MPTTIACNCSAVGAYGKILIESSGSAPRTFTSGSKKIQFLQETVGTERKLQHTEAINGTLSRAKNGVREKSYIVQGIIAVQPSPTELDFWYPRIFGGAAGTAGSGLGPDVDADGNDKNYPLTNTIPSFDAMIYRENGIFQYTDLMVAQALIRGKAVEGGDAPDFLEMILVLVGKKEIITQSGSGSWPGTDPTVATTDDMLPYAFWESKLFLNNTELPVDDFSLMVDNRLAIRRWNDISPQCIRSTGRVVTLKATVPFTCSALAQSLTMNSASGTAELRFATPRTTPKYHSSIEMPFARSTFKTPTIKGKTDLPLEIELEAFADVGNDELRVTNDNDPNT